MLLVHLHPDPTHTETRVAQRNGHRPRTLTRRPVATGVRADGWREVLGFAVGDSEDGTFWPADNQPQN